MTGISGAGVALVAGGGVLVFSGVENTPVTQVFRSLARGQKPAAGPEATVAANAETISDATGIPFTPPSTALAAANQAVARVLAAPYGWSTGQEWAALVALWNRESSWDNTAQDPTSTAYGIAQFLDTTWAPYGPKTSDPALQIRYGLEYIRATYGDPVTAWQHEESEGWY
jgi:Transglycosylase SLT domain